MNANDGNSHPRRIFSETLSKVDIFEKAVYPFTCGQRKGYFLNADVTSTYLRMLNAEFWRLRIVLAMAGFVWLRVDGSVLDKKKYAFTNINVFVLRGPQFLV